MTAEKEVPLLPCPFCGGRPEGRSGSSSIWFACPNCGANGPESWGESEAVDSWNRRAIVVPAQQAVPEGWKPIETAPKDNKRPLYLASFSDKGELQEIDFDGSWESESESWEIPQVYYFWASANGRVEEPTHWCYQDAAPQAPAQKRIPDFSKDWCVNMAKMEGNSSISAGGRFVSDGPDPMAERPTDPTLEAPAQPDGRETERANFDTHCIYKTGDADAPEVIMDGSGGVALDLCRNCGRGEVELLESPCDKAPAQPDDCAHCGGVGDVAGGYPGCACPACNGTGKEVKAKPARPAGNRITVDRGAAPPKAEASALEPLVICDEVNDGPD